MFTGIVRETGQIVDKRLDQSGATFEVRCQEIFDGLEIGHSVSIDGCCLTVIAKGNQSFKVEATPETLRLTNLGEKEAGDVVNLEPAARLTDFLGGHLVQGHVDGTGSVQSICPEGNSKVFRFSAPAAVMHYCTMKGSVTVNGVSLTISGLGADYFEVTIIPHTWEVTNFGTMKPGEKVNLEADVISKYVEAHVRRVLGGAAAVLLMISTVLAGSIPNPSQTTLIYHNVVAKRETPFVVRVARFQPDIFLEWESSSHQGTVHMHRKAVTEGRRFALDRLFEVGVDTDSPDVTVLWLPRSVFAELLKNGGASIQFNGLPMKLKVLGEETFALNVDKRSQEVAAVRIEDERKNVWVFHKDEQNPLLLEYTTPHYRQYLKSIMTTSWPGLKWIKKIPPVK